MRYRLAMDGPARLLPAVLSTFHAQRVCIIKPSALGDVVQALPVLAAVRRRFPRAHIAWVIHRSLAGLLAPIPILNEVIPFDRDAFRERGWRGLAQLRQVWHKLRDARFDLSIDLQGLFRSGLLAWATGAERRVGLASAREAATLFYTDVVNDAAGPRNAVDRYWEVAAALGVGRQAKEFPLFLTPVERAQAAHLIAGLPRPILAIQAGARWSTKRWPAERFAEAATTVLSQRGGSAVLVGSADEAPIAAAVAERLRLPTRNLAGRTSLRLLAAVLEQCDVLLTNDTGPMHLAAAVGTSTVSIFTCTAPERAAPVGAQHRVVQTSVPCRASYLKTCSSMICMKDLTADRLLPVLDAALGCAARAGHDLPNAA